MMSCRRSGSLSLERPLRKLSIWCVFDKVGGSDGDDACPKFVYGRGEGNGYVIIKQCGVPFLKDEACAAGGPGRGGVSGEGHGLEQEGEGFVEWGGHGLQDLGRDVVRAKGLAAGQTKQAFFVSLRGYLSVETRWREGRGRRDICLQREWGGGVDSCRGGEGLFGKVLDALDDSDKGCVVSTIGVQDRGKGGVCGRGGGSSPLA